MDIPEIDPQENSYTFAYMDPSRGCEHTIVDTCMKLFEGNSQIPRRAIAFPKGKTSTVFEYRSENDKDACTPSECWGAAIGSALLDHLLLADADAPIYVLISRRPSNVSPSKTSLALYISVLADYPDDVIVDSPFLELLVSRLPVQGEGDWMGFKRPGEFTPVMWRLKWFEMNILRAAWAPDLWSNISLDEDGRGPDELRKLPASSAYGP